MATAETVKAQLQADIAAANAATGKKDATMHDAVASLIEGFGGGVEIYQTKAGTMYTPIFTTGDFPFGRYTTSSNLLSYADKLIEATFPNWEGVFGGANTNPISNSSVQRAYFPKLKVTTTYVAESCPNLVDIVFGSVGYPVSGLYSRSFYGNTNNPDLVITVYVDAATLADIPTAVSGNLPGSAVDATIIYRNSTTGEVITE